ncbi:G- coupled receptor Mth2, partial [Olea europaea subsp. europaea]
GYGGLRGSASERDRRKFCLYSFYAWGSALCIQVVTVSLHLLGDWMPAWIVTVDIGKTTCYFESQNARLAYFVGPAAVLLICNALLFLHTAIRILTLSRETSVLRSAESQRHRDEKQR